MRPRTPSQPSRDRAYLIVLAGPNVGEMFKVEEELVIGRSSGCEAQVRGEGVSRRHARILRQGGDLFLEDLGSTNGTWANGDRVARHLLYDGDRIQLGATTILKFTYHDLIDETFQRQMYESALRDSLTRIFNRAYFFDRLEAEFAFALRHRVPLSLVLFDLDHFKSVNDSRGHLVGDGVLQKVAAAVSHSTRQEDVFARYGGEEFGVICRAVGLAGALVFAERVRRVVAALRIEGNGARVPVTVSLGVAALPDPSVTSPIDLIERADRALFQAKREGRNRVIAFTPETP